MPVTFGLGINQSENLAWNLGELSGLDGGSGGGAVRESTVWIDNYGEAMRDNLGNILYFNTNEAA